MRKWAPLVLWWKAGDMVAVEASCQHSVKKVMFFSWTQKGNGFSHRKVDIPSFWLLSVIISKCWGTGIFHDILQKFCNFGNCLYLYEKTWLAKWWCPVYLQGNMIPKLGSGLCYWNCCYLITCMIFVVLPIYHPFCCWWINSLFVRKY